MVTCGPECDSVLRKANKTSNVARARAKACGHGIVAEPVIDTRVFDAAQWRCTICRISTPQGLRGTFKPDAPEIDHIVALADGGDHTYANVQCLCRLCNVAKGGHPFPHITFWRRRGLDGPVI